MAGLLAVSPRAHPLSPAASVQLWRSRLGRVMCSMANCLLLMKVPFLRGGEPWALGGEGPHAACKQRG